MDNKKPIFHYMCDKEPDDNETIMFEFKIDDRWFTMVGNYDKEGRFVYLVGSLFGIKAHPDDKWSRWKTQYDR